MFVNAVYHALLRRLVILEHQNAELLTLLRDNDEQNTRLLAQLGAYYEAYGPLPPGPERDEP
jgi:hypothetical protein